MLEQIFGFAKGLRTLGSSPAVELASEVNTDDLRALQFPRKTSHDVDSIGTTNTASNHTETTSIRSMRICADHQTTGERIVFEDDLVDDSRAGFPETETVLEFTPHCINTR